MNWSMRICQIGEVTGFVFTGYLFTVGYYVASYIIFICSLYLADCASQCIEEEVKNKYDIKD